MLKLTEIEVKFAFFRNMKKKSLSLFKTFISYLKSPNTFLLLLSKVLIDLAFSVTNVILDCVPLV